MKPTIGRIVHFEDWLYGTCAAIITNVDLDNDRCLLGLFHKGPPGEYQPSVVYHAANFSETPKQGHWSWPPIEGDLK